MRVSGVLKLLGWVGEIGWGRPVSDEYISLVWKLECLRVINGVNGVNDEGKIRIGVQYGLKEQVKSEMHKSAGFGCTVKLSTTAGEG